MVIYHSNIPHLAMHSNRVRSLIELPIPYRTRVGTFSLYSSSAFRSSRSLSGHHLSSFRKFVDLQFILPRQSWFLSRNRLGIVLRSWSTMFSIKKKQTERYSRLSTKRSIVCHYFGAACKLRTAKLLLATLSY